MAKVTKLRRKVLVYQYFTYNGSFASSRTLLWMYTLVGAKGEEHYPSDDGWNGHSDKKFAMKSAIFWSNFLGWEIIDIGYDERRDAPLKPIDPEYTRQIR